MSESEGRVLVVTGGNSGIGRGIARYFGGRGFRVAIVGRNPETLRSTAEEIGANCLSFRADVAKRDQVLAAVKGIVDAWGRMDVLVNNAGNLGSIFTTTPIEEAERIFRQTIDIHLTGAFLMVMASAPHLTRPGGGASSISVRSALSAAAGWPARPPTWRRRPGCTALPTPGRGNSARRESP